MEVNSEDIQQIGALVGTLEIQVVVLQRKVRELQDKVAQLENPRGLRVETITDEGGEVYTVTPAEAFDQWEKEGES